jgi:phenylalanine-4-hydroxylase
MTFENDNALDFAVTSSGVTMPTGPLSVEVVFKARPSDPVHPSPSPEGAMGTTILPPIYAAEQHNTWRELFERQSQVLLGRVCDEYLEGRRCMAFPSDRVPHLAYASEMLERRTGWRVVRVAGYVPEDVFFKILANRAFPCTDFIRHPDEFEYTPAPDMFHDLMGHLPMITNPRFAKFFHQYGMAGMRAKTPEQIQMLGRIYWFTVEFGLINPTAHDGAGRDPARCQIYGAGISSSVGEIVHSLSETVTKKPFDIDLIAATEFDIHKMQPTLFEISGFDELESEFARWSKENGLA